jgi:hypothetical protein
MNHDVLHAERLGVLLEAYLRLDWRARASIQRQQELVSMMREAVGSAQDVDDADLATALLQSTLRRLADSVFGEDDAAVDSLFDSR